MLEVIVGPVLAVLVTLKLTDLNLKKQNKTTTTIRTITIQIMIGFFSNHPTNKDMRKKKIHWK